MNDVRWKIAENARWGAAEEPQIHYTQGPERDDFLFLPPRPLPMSTDCSGFWTACCKWAGAPDPSGLDYEWVGWTGTMVAALEECAVADLLPGDGVIWGPGVGKHVAVVVEAGADPLLVSHGQERGPIYIRTSAETRFQGSPARPFKLPVDDSAPAPQPHPDPKPHSRRRRRMIVFQLQSHHDAGDNFYHVWEGPGAWSQCNKMSDALSLVAGTGQASIPVISDDQYHLMGGK